MFIKKRFEAKKAEALEIPSAPLYVIAGNKGTTLSDMFFCDDLSILKDLPESYFYYISKGAMRPRSASDRARLLKKAKEAGIRFYNNDVNLKYGQSIYVHTITVYPVSKLPGTVDKSYPLAVINGEIMPRDEASAYLKKWADENGFDYAKVGFPSKGDS